MKKQVKRILASALAAMTLTSSLPMSVFATNLTSADSVDFSQYATGDLSLGDGAVPSGVDTIGSAKEYNDLIASSNGPVTTRSATALPSSVDNSTSPYFPPIKSQGSLGSCNAFASTYYQFTFAMNKSMGVKTTEKNAFSPKWVYNKINGGHDDVGSYYYDACEFLKSQGAVTLKDVPYDEKDFKSWMPSEDLWTKSLDYRLKSYQRIELPSDNTPITSPKDTDLDVLKAPLANGELLTFSTYVKSWNYALQRIVANSNAPENQKYAGDYITTAVTGYDGGHRMTIIGYNDDIWYDINGNGKVETAEKGAFKIANSWGDDFGNAGFMWVSYDALNKVSAVSGAPKYSQRHAIFEQVVRIEVQDFDSDADINLVYTLNSAKRNQTIIRVFAKDTSGNWYASEVSPYGDVEYDYINNTHPGAPTNGYSYDGTTYAHDGTMVFALDNIVPGLTSDTFNDYTWTVYVEDTQKDSYPFIVKNLKIVDENTAKTYVPVQTLPKTFNGDGTTIDFKNASNDYSVVLVSSKSNNIGVYEKLNFTAKVTGGTAPYQYKYEYTNNGKTTLIKDYSTSNTFSLQASEAGTYNVKVTVKDAKGKTTSYNRDMIYNNPVIMSIVSDGNKGTVGSMSYFSPEIQNLSNVFEEENYVYTITKDGKSEKLVSNLFGGLSWTPDEAGTYQIKLDIVYNGKTLATKTENYEVAERNKIVIYYKGYSTPYIHYQVYYGSWTTVPGKKMPTSNEVSGYTHKYTIDLGEYEHATVCFNDGNNNWDNNDTKNYMFKTGVYTFSNGKITPYTPPAPSATLSVSKTSNIGLYEKLTFTAKATSGAAPYQYKYTYTKDGKTYTIKDFSSSTTCTLQTSETGTYNVQVTVKDANGKTATATKSVTCNQTTITSLTPSKSTAAVGETIKITPQVSNLADIMTASNFTYTITKNGVSTAYQVNSDKTLTWTPTAEGTYQIKASIVYNGKSISTKTLDFVVKNPQLSATIGTTKYVNVGLYEKLTFTTKAVGGTAPYQYKYEYSMNGQTYLIKDFSSSNTCEFQMGEIGTYAVSVTVKDATGKTVTAKDSVTYNNTYIMKFISSKSSATVGDTVKFSVETNNLADIMTASNFVYTVTKDGTTSTLKTNSDKSASWTPTAEGTYKVKVAIVYNGKTLTSTTRDYVVEKKVENILTIYYKGYSTPYIHYQIAGKSWTAVPGVKMTASSEVSGYTHKIVINLGTATYATVCFNNGSGTWDNNDTKNYKFNAGTYTFSNKTITPYTPQALSATLTSSKVANIGVYDKITLTAKATGGTAPYQYKFEYFVAGETLLIKDFSSSNTCTFQKDISGYYVLYVTVKDATGKTVKVSTSVNYNNTYVMELNADKSTATVGETVKFSGVINNLANIMTTSNIVYTVTKDGKTTTLTTNSDKTASWTPTAEGTYQVKLAVVYNGKTLSSRYINYVVKNAELKATLSSSKNLNCGNYENHTITAKATGGTAPYQYKFYYKNGGTTYGIQDFSTTNTYKFQPTASGTYYVYVTIKDATGKSVTENITVTSNATLINSLTADQTKGTVGKAVKFKASLLNEPSVFTSANYTYTVSKNGSSAKLTTNSDKTATWTPAAEGTYQVKLVISYNGKEIASKTINYVVEKKVENTLTIYYKGYSTPYIHYQIAGKSWTTAPGVKMTATTEVSGYTHKIVINLSTATYATVCFNNGSGSWDNNNSKNYKFNAGTYTFSGGKITEYDDKAFKISSFTVSPSNGIVNINDTVKMSVALNNAPSTAFIQFAYKDSNGNEYTIYDYSTATSASKQFTKAGTYTLIVRVKESLYSSNVLTATKTITVQDPKANTLTIYYKGYSTPYIHYQVGNGGWTAVPGVKMTATSEKAGYTHKAVIPLGSSTYANVCFNDGNGNWDSRNGANYKFYAGTYTFANGKYTKI